MRAGLFCASIAAVALAVVVARAQTSPVVHIDFTAAPGCPTENAFVDQLVARAPSARVAAPNEKARTLRVRVAARSGTYEGRVIVRELDGAESARDVRGERCEEVVSALALIAAVAVDPAVAGQRAPVFTEDAGSELADASPAPAPADASPRSPPAASSSPPTPTFAPADVALWQAPASRGWRLRAGAGVEALFGATPDATVAWPTVHVDLHREAGAVFAPSFRARVASATDETAFAHFAWTTVGADACPLTLAAGAFSFVPCARGQIGALYARGMTGAPSFERTRPWASLGAVARARVDVIGTLGLEIETSLFLPLIRDRYTLDPSSTLFKAAVVGWTVGGGASLVVW